MDWLILLLLVPALLVPMVLLHGFAGCYNPRTLSPPSAPKNLTATAVPSTGMLAAVSLAWENTDATAITLVERALDGGDFTPLPDPNDSSKTLVVVGETFLDETATPGTTFLYRVRAGNVLTSDDTSNIVSVTTFKTAFLAEELVGGIDQTMDEGITLVQIFASTLLLASGQLVNLTLRGPGVGSLTLDKICISNQDPTGPSIGQDYQPDLLPTTVATAIVLSKKATPIPPVGSFFVDQSKPLLVAFDINLAAGTGRFFTQPPGAVAWAKKIPGVSLNEAGVKPRSAGYGKSAGPELFLVQKIEVM